VTGARQAQPGLYFGFSESPARLIRKAGQIGLDLSRLTAEGSLDIHWQPTWEATLDSLGERLLAAIDQAQARRVFIDGIEGFRRSINAEGRFHLFLVALAHELQARGVTSITSAPLHNLFGPLLDIALDDTSAIAANILLLRQVELKSHLYRLVSILKVGESAYDPNIREFRITPTGLDVAETFESAEAILTGIARSRD
jgi:circadian clock protein KaiC